MGDTSWTLVQTSDQETRQRHWMHGEGRGDQGGYWLGRMLKGLFEEGCLASGNRKAGGRSDRGRVLGQRQRE